MAILPILLFFTCQYLTFFFLDGLVNWKKKRKVKVSQLCQILWILQARILEWLAFFFSRGSSQPRDRTQVSRTVGRSFTSWATREAPPPPQKEMHTIKASNFSFIWDLIENYTQELASQIALRNCSQVGSEEPGHICLWGWEVHVVKHTSWYMCAQSLSFVQLFATPWTIAYQASLSMEPSRQEYWSGLPFPTLRGLPDPGIELQSLSLLHRQVDSLPLAPPGKSIHLSKRLLI